jgi:predicted amidohydrolase
MAAYPALKKWARLAAADVPHHYATRIGVPTVFVNQGGSTITPCQTPRFYHLPTLKYMRYDFCGKSSIRDPTGRILVQANGNEDEYYAVESVAVGQAKPPPEPVRSDIANRYLNANYYIVQPPLIAKIFQAVFTYGLQDVYDSRRKKYASINPE